MKELHPTSHIHNSSDTTLLLNKATQVKDFLNEVSGESQLHSEIETAIKVYELQKGGGKKKPVLNTEDL